MVTREQRFLRQPLSEVRAVTQEGEAEGVTITGKGMVFNQASEMLGGFFREYIDPDALKNAKLEGMLSFFNHDSNFILGNMDNRTLSIDITSEAVIYTTSAPGTATIRDLVIAPIVRGDVRGSSYIFDIDWEEGNEGDEWVKGADGVWERYVKRVKQVYEMGPVSMPAYSQSTTSVEPAKRSFDAFLKEFREQEKVQTLHNRKLAEARLRRLKLA